MNTDGAHPDLPTAGESYRTMQPHAFWRHVGPPEANGCWLWTGHINDIGYGLTWFGPGNRRGAHRVAYELAVGSIPEGLVIDHLCRVRSCVRPDHLEAVTPAENTRRGLRGRLVTACPVGHEYTEENTRYCSGGRRRCKTCDTERKRQCRAALKAAGLTAHGKPYMPPPATCKNGHELTDDNIYFRSSRPNARECRTCLNVRNLARRESERASRAITACANDDRDAALLTAMLGLDVVA